ncbi:MAG: winged helix-turn-helix domain-containing protein [Deltaproteobacteria bacterium]|jgi:hypothetical protein|nr:winged helix-turn-helix domain-containing protein [Deltaproteobacteria bacterium]
MIKPDLSLDDLLKPLLILSASKTRISPKTDLPTFVAVLRGLKDAQAFLAAGGALERLTEDLAADALSHLEAASLITLLPDGRYMATPEGTRLAATSSPVTRVTLNDISPGYEGTLELRRGTADQTDGGWGDATETARDANGVRDAPPPATPAARASSADGVCGDTALPLPGWPFTDGMCLGNSFPGNYPVTAAVLSFIGSKPRPYSLKEIQADMFTRLRQTAGLQKIRKSGKVKKWLGDKARYAVSALREERCLENVRRGAYEITDIGKWVRSKRLESISQKALKQLVLGFPSGLQPSPPPTVPAPPDAVLTAQQGGGRSDRAASDALNPADAMKEFLILIRDRVIATLESKISRLKEKPLEDLARRLKEPLRLASKNPAVADDGKWGCRIEGLLESTVNDETSVRFMSKAGGPASRADVEAMLQAMNDANEVRGIFVCPCGFNPDALSRIEEYAGMLCALDAKKLASLMYGYGVGVDVRRKLVCRVPDPRFFAGIDG